MLRTTFDLGSQHKRILGILFDYLFGKIGKFEYRRQIGDRQLAKSVWAKAEHNGYILRNCKLYAYAYAVNSVLGLATSPGRFEIDKDDVSFLRTLDLSHLDLSEYKAYSLFDFEQLEGAVLTSNELKVYIGKYISKKLIFLVRNFGVVRDELHHTMLTAGMTAIRKQYPIFKSDLHALNIAKTSIKNKGNELIEWHTRAKRNALRNEGGGNFSAVNVSFDLINHIAIKPEHDDDIRVLRRSLITLLPKLKPAAQDFVQAAVGVHDVGFSVYLGLDNRDAVEAWDYKKRYLPSLCAYLKVTPTQADRLLGHLKTVL